MLVEGNFSYTTNNKTYPFTYFIIKTNALPNFFKHISQETQIFLEKYIFLFWLSNKTEINCIELYQISINIYCW